MRRKNLAATLYEQKFFHFWAALGVIFIFVISFASTFGLIIAFKDYSIADGMQGMFTSDWVGLKHFKAFFLDANFTRILRNTLILSGLKLLFSFPMPVILAIFLTEMRFDTLKRFSQTVSYLPHFVSWVVTASLVHVFFNSTASGLINSLLLSTGLIGEPISFLTDPGRFWQLAVISDVWKETGWWSIIFISAISSIDPGLYEAASIDGATRRQRILHITLPGIADAIGVVLIISIGNIFTGGMSGSNFDQSFLMGNNMVLNTSEIIPTYVYKMGILGGRYSYATAIGLFQAILSLVFIFGSNYLSRRLRDEDEGLLL